VMAPLGNFISTPMTSITDTRIEIEEKLEKWWWWILFNLVSFDSLARVISFQAIFGYFLLRRRLDIDRRTFMSITRLEFFHASIIFLSFSSLRRNYLYKMANRQLHRLHRLHRV
jgi:hypothetical protein